MADLGEWTEADYRFEKTKLTNQIERENIVIERAKLDIKEILLKVDDLTLIIDKAKQRQEEMKKQINWCSEQLEKYG